MNHQTQMRCRLPNFLPPFPLRPIRLASTVSSHAQRAPRPLSPCVPRTLNPFSAPVAYSGFPGAVPSTTCNSRLSIDVYRPALSRTPQQQNESFFPYSSGPPTIGAWSDRLLHGKDISDIDKTHSEKLKMCEMLKRVDDDPLESFLTYLNDAFPDASDFERPSGCRLSIQDEPLIAESNVSSKGALEWDEDCIAFNESLALKEPDHLDSIPVKDIKDNEEVERIAPRKIKQCWIKSSQLEAEQEAQSCGRPLRLEWPVPGSRSSGPYFILAPFWIDVNHRSAISESLSCVEEDSVEKDDKKNTIVEEARLCDENCTSLDNRTSQLSIPKVTRKKRKQTQPCKSLPLVDAKFKGVTIRFQTLFQKDSSQLLMQHTYSNIPHKTSKCRLRKRSHETYSSSDSCSDIDEPFPCQDDWISLACPGKQCASCGTKKTPLWRDAEDGTPLCNACGIRYKKYRLRCPRCWHIPRKDGKSHSRCGCCGASLR